MIILTKNQLKSIAWFVVISIIIIGIFLPPKRDFAETLNFSFTWWQIFSTNLFIFIIWWSLTITGFLSIITVFLFLSKIPGVLIGAANHYEVSLPMVIISGTSHGIGEIILSFYIIYISLLWIMFWINKLLKKDSRSVKNYFLEQLQFLYSRKWIIIGILFISSILEVYVSMPLYRSIIGH